MGLRTSFRTGYVRSNTTEIDSEEVGEIQRSYGNLRVTPHPLTMPWFPPKKSMYFFCLKGLLRDHGDYNPLMRPYFLWGGFHWGSSCRFPWASLASCFGVMSRVSIGCAPSDHQNYSIFSGVSYKPSFGTVAGRGHTQCIYVKVFLVCECLLVFLSVASGVIKPLKQWGQMFDTPANKHGKWTSATWKGKSFWKYPLLGSMWSFRECTCI